MNERQHQPPHRRTVLKFGVAGICAATLPGALTYLGTDKAHVEAGWIPDHNEFKRHIARTQNPYFRQQAAANTQDSGKNRVALLYKYLERALGGPIEPHMQALGDCVAQAYGLGTDILGATQIYGGKRNEVFKGKFSTEAMYGGSRHEIGLQKYHNELLKMGDGSIGAYCAEFLQSYGALLRRKYGEHDLTKYNPALAKEWGQSGVPDHLEPTCREHPVKSYALVRSYEDCRDAIVNGHPVIFCSGVGFNPNSWVNRGGRDRHGFLKPSGVWFHAMAGIAVDDEFFRPGILIANSWGDWLQGPTRHDQPKGTFWVEADVITRMVKSQDCYAISHFTGFPRQALDFTF